MLNVRRLLGAVSCALLLAPPARPQEPALIELSAWRSFPVAKSEPDRVSHAVFDSPEFAIRLLEIKPGASSPPAVFKSPTLIAHLSSDDAVVRPNGIIVFNEPSAVVAASRYGGRKPALRLAFRLADTYPMDLEGSKRPRLTPAMVKQRDVLKILEEEGTPDKPHHLRVFFRGVFSTAALTVRRPVEFKSSIREDAAWLMMKGDALIDVGGKSMLAKPGHLLVLKKGTPGPLAITPMGGDFTVLQVVIDSAKAARPPGSGPPRPAPRSPR